MIAEFMEDLLPDASSKEDQRLVSVYDYMTSAWPPVFLMAAHGDYLMEAAPEMERKLKALGVPCTFKVYGTPQSPEYHDFRPVRNATTTKRDSSAHFYDSLRPEHFVKKHPAWMFFYAYLRRMLLTDDRYPPPKRFR